MVVRPKKAYFPRVCISCKKSIWWEIYADVRIGGVDATLCKECTDILREGIGLEPMFRDENG